MNSLQWSIITITLLGALGIYYFFKSKKVKEQYVVVINGWYFIKWNIFKQNKYIKDTIRRIEESDDSIHLCTESLKDWFKLLHFRNSHSLLIACNKVKLNDEMVTEDKLKLKRAISASGVLFGFKVPKALWLFDEITLEVIIRYSVVCDVIELDFSKYEIHRDIPPTQNERDVFSMLIENINAGMFIINKLNAGTRPPNFQILIEHISKSYPKLWKALDQNPYSLKKLMTICYSISTGYIPKDYISFDPLVYRALVMGMFKNEIEPKKKSHLTLVQD